MRVCNGCGCKWNGVGRHYLAIDRVCGDWIEVSEDTAANLKYFTGGKPLGGPNCRRCGGQSNGCECGKVYPISDADFQALSLGHLSPEQARMQQMVSYQDQNLDIIPTEELRKLREENARLQAQLNGKLIDASTVSKEQWKDACDRSAEAQRLRMELADAKAKAARWAETVNLQRDELDFCKREIKRLDPRLAKARWGL